MAESKNAYLKKAVLHYGNLFSLPEYLILLLIFLFTSLCGSIIAFYIVVPGLNGILDGIIFSLQVLFLPTIIMDTIFRETIMKVDLILNPKRSTALSLAICIVVILLITIGSILQVFLRVPNALYRATFIGVCATVTMRYLVLSTITQLSYQRFIFLIIIYPTIHFISNLFFWQSWSTQIVVATMASCTLLVIATRLFIRTINRQGESIVGIGSISLFKGFLFNWFEGITHPLEEYFEKLGKYVDVSISHFSFRIQNKLKAFLVIPNVHPGPFKNLGSSNLPNLIQNTLNEKFGAITAVPHGLSGHELDLTSKLQCDKIVKEILKINPLNFSDKASKLIRYNTGTTEATCQFFGKTALLTVTCIPNIEDISLEAGEEIMRKGRQLEVKQIAIINAHNSIGTANEELVLSKKKTNEIVFAAQKVLESASNEEQHPFFLGIAKVIPSDFGIRQGMGPGGIVALVVIVAEQKAVYIIIDGNNMVRGLRDKIIRVLDRFDECEVLTTDTHIVNAIITTARGYYPIGEVIDHTRLISYVKNVAAKALKGAKKTEVSFSKVKINNIKIIGENTLVKLTMLIDLTVNLVKRITPLIYIPAAIAALLPFLFI